MSAEGVFVIGCESLSSFVSFDLTQAAAASVDLQSELVSGASFV